MFNKNCGNGNHNIKKVFNGDFPKEALKKMSLKRLEQFVLELVECSSDAGAKNAKDFTGLYRGLCLKEINKPEWWPSERIIAQSLTSDGKYLMELLRFLVYKCCEFFKKPSENLNSQLFVTENDENCQGVKRKCVAVSNEVPSKRRTLLPKNVSPKSKSVAVESEILFQNPFIPLQDILCKPTPKPLSQDEFLNVFGLQNAFHHSIEDPPVATVSTSIKFNTCLVVPFSSDLGRELMKRDNHVCPDTLKTRRLERLEWYVNKPSTHKHICYEVNYQEKKGISLRSYKFPKRQIWQHPGDTNFQKKALFCQRLTVVLVRQNLEALREEISRKSKCKLKIVITRMNLDVFEEQQVNNVDNVMQKSLISVSETENL